MDPITDETASQMSATQAIARWQAGVLAALESTGDALRAWVAEAAPLFRRWLRTVRHEPTHRKRTVRRFRSRRSALRRREIRRELPPFWSPERYIPAPKLSASMDPRRLVWSHDGRWTLSAHTVRKPWRVKNTKHRRRILLRIAYGPPHSPGARRALAYANRLRRPWYRARLG